jgi:hypothetical protein
MDHTKEALSFNHSMKLTYEALCISKERLDDIEDFIEGITIKGVTKLSELVYSVLVGARSRGYDMKDMSIAIALLFKKYCTTSRGDLADMLAAAMAEAMQRKDKKR